MLYEQWIEMEQFYYNDLWIFVIISCILAAVMFPILFYIKKTSFKVFTIISLLFMAFTAWFAYQGYSKYGELIELSFLSNPATRTYQTKLFNNFPYSHMELSQYRVGYLRSSFERLPMYDEQLEIRDDIEYAGTDGTYYYFTYGQYLNVYTSHKNVQFTDTDKTTRVGYQYTLNDPQFEEIGFIPSSIIYFDHYEVPKDLKDKKVSQEIMSRSEYQFGGKGTLRGWSIP